MRFSRLPAAPRRIHIVIHFIDQGGQAHVITQPGADFPDLIQAVMPAVNVLARHLRGILQIRPVAREERNILAARFQHIQGMQVIGQIAVRF